MSAHIPVMLEEVMAVLAPRDDAIYIDATFGGGGYTAALLARARCTVYAIDRDEDAIARGQALAERFAGRLTLMHGRFSEMDALLAGRPGTDTSAARPQPPARASQARSWSVRALLKRLLVAEDRRLPVFGPLVGATARLCGNMMMYVAVK